MKKLRNVLDFISEKTSILLFGITVILVVWQVAARYIFNSPLTWSETLAKYLFVWLVLINSAYIFGKKEHMNIGFFKDQLPLKAQLVLSFVVEAAVLGFAVCILLSGGWAAMKIGAPQKDAALKISMGYIYGAIPISGLLTMLYTVCNIADRIAAMRKGE